MNRVVYEVKTVGKADPRRRDTVNLTKWSKVLRTNLEKRDGVEVVSVVKKTYSAGCAEPVREIVESAASSLSEMRSRHSVTKP